CRARRRIRFTEWCRERYCTLDGRCREPTPILCVAAGGPEWRSPGGHYGFQGGKINEHASFSWGAVHFAGRCADLFVWGRGQGGRLLVERLGQRRGAAGCPSPLQEAHSGRTGRL